MQNQAYKGSGVNLDAAREAKARIFRRARSTFTKGVLGDIGAFGALFKPQKMKTPVFVSHIDNVGTKLRVAGLVGKYDTVGEDLVNHCANDILTCGAKPLFFLDYIGSDHMDPDRIESIIEGIARACEELGCALVGGETAELPGLYQPDGVDLVGFVVGAVEQDELIADREITSGDILLGVTSNGLHTNGYSLARQVFGIEENPGILKQYTPSLGMTLGEALLVPHRSYTALLNPILDQVKALAHITGGGLVENVPRVLPQGLVARFDPAKWEAPAIFGLIQTTGHIADDEMYRVFNMGIGMVLIAGVEEARRIQARVPEVIAIGSIDNSPQAEPAVEIQYLPPKGE